METGVQINTFYVSQKISKIRWIPEPLGPPKKFITGSWDNAGKNAIKLWKLVKNVYFKNENEFVPKCADKFSVKEDITDVVIINSEKFLFSSDDGHVRLMHINDLKDDAQIIEQEKSETLHKNQFNKPSSCTGISVFDKSVASIGEDGRVNILNLNNLKKHYQLQQNDDSSLTALSFITLAELLVANRMENENRSNIATSLCWHPTQKHIIFAGTEEGSITIWDLRQPNFPASYLSAHSSSITEINFDRSQHTKLYTTSENGEMWQWNQNSSLDLQLSSTNLSDMSEINPWLNGERTKSKINVTSVISGVGKAINSFDAVNSKIICGCDSEAIYHIDNILENNTN
ncbi:nucleoporin Nup43 isoform X2 [Condylostylus longicornis]|uniref:nucleoporin Nup43 isoform X2 n=1 Tax=Condylostylus longicornis TaxID=2530218 RepID=UPI00244DBC07|nr:nucleoporin Nup43 isoform X2 [Condylostylus longicornis]